MKQRTQVILTLVVIVIIAAVVAIRSTLFTVNERELAVVLQFGEPVISYSEPGLKWKIPIIQEVHRLPKTLQFWAGTGSDVLIDLPTADGKKIEVTPWAIWKITDPKRFVEVLRTVDKAELRVATFVRSEMRDAITANDLVEVVRSTDRPLSYTFQVEEPLREDEAPKSPEEADSGDDSPEDGDSGDDGESPEIEIPAIQQPGADRDVRVGRKQIVEKIKQTVLRRLEEGGSDGKGGRGIELVDVGIARIDFVPAVQQAAFDRLIAFMESIAARHTNEGQRRKQEILNRTEAEVQKILGEGQRESNEIRGQVEAQIIQNYAEAIKQTGEFYNFVRTLEAYEKAIGAKTRLVLSTDSELFGLLKQVPPPGTAPTAVEAASDDTAPDDQ